MRFVSPGAITPVVVFLLPEILFVLLVSIDVSFRIFIAKSPDALARSMLSSEIPELIESLRPWSVPSYSKFC